MSSSSDSLSRLPAGRDSAPTTVTTRIDARELPGDAEGLARFLIGRLLVHARPGLPPIIGRIVETEAYLADDEASHSYRGVTRRNASMFLAAGHAYCYLSYGCWTALNVTSGPAGKGEAVLLRAAEVLAGSAALPPVPRLPAAKIASGPGRLGRAFAVTLGHDGIDLCTHPDLYLAYATDPGDGNRSAPIGASPRIGISKAVERPLRFFEVGSAALSGPRRLNVLGPADPSS